MKKFLILILILIILVSVVIGIVILNTKKETKDNNKLQIIATLFPQYDFVKQIGKDKVDVTLLLPAGVETHTYEPTPKDITNINNADLFIYTGENMEPWAQTIVKAIDSNTDILDVSKNIELINQEEFEKTNSKSLDEETEYEEHEEHAYDPHIWLNPKYAIKMCENIRDTLCILDKENSNYYIKNTEEYIAKLIKLDSDIGQVVKLGKRNKIAFGGSFAYAYFIERYNLDFITAYSSCGEEAEPSVAQVKKVVDYIKQNNIPVIFYQELTQGNVAKTIAEETNAIPMIFNTIHNISKEDIENGVTYLSVMKQNLENLKQALN